MKTDESREGVTYFRCRLLRGVSLQTADIGVNKIVQEQGSPRLVRFIAAVSAGMLAA